jgi:hypothetical protein
LIARTALKVGAMTLFTFENKNELVALPIASTLRKIKVYFITDVK